VLCFQLYGDLPEDLRSHIFIVHLKTAVLNKGDAVVKLVEALCYKPEGRGFDSR
jgi:hypothetical protein